MMQPMLIVLDVLPNGLTGAGSVTASGNYDFDTGLWTIGTIPSGSTVVTDHSTLSSILHRL